MLYQSRLRREQRHDLQRGFPSSASTAIEQRLLFAKPKRGELAPLTILPNREILPAAA